MGFILFVALELIVIPAFVVLAGVLCVLAWERVSRSPLERAIRDQERHARRTARAMRRMGAIRRRTAERMDRAEAGGWR
jgi:hypothetical protein